MYDSKQRKEIKSVILRQSPCRSREEFKAENGFEMPEIDEPFDIELPDGAIAHNRDELEEWYASRGERF